MNTNKGGIVKQSGNDVEGYRSQKVLFQPSVRVFLQYSVRAVFHLAEFSARNDIFFCLLTPTLCQLVFEQKKMSLLEENSAQWKMALKATSHSTVFDIPMRPMREVQRHRQRFTR